MDMPKGIYTKGNKNDLHKAIDALDAFTKAWCMDCEATEKLDKPVFRCKECPFQANDKTCAIKKFCYDRDDRYTREIDFGSMGCL